MTLNLSETVRDIAVQNPESVRVFESLGIDYCCGGKRPLKEACERANVSTERVLEMLQGAASDQDLEDLGRWPTASIAELSEYIVATHHRYVRRETPRLETLLEKVAAKHGDAHPELATIKETFSAMAQELFAHTLKEEQVLFPYLTKLEAAVLTHAPVPPAFFGSVRNPIARMLADHDDAGELLTVLRDLSENYQVPAGGCPSYHALYRGLEEFERDLHRHVHLENNILFPRAVQMESSAQPAEPVHGRV